MCTRILTPPVHPCRRVGATTSLNLLLNLTKDLVWGAINVTLPPGWHFGDSGSRCKECRCHQ